MALHWKRQEADDILLKLRTLTMQMALCFLQIYRPKVNPYCLASTWMQTKMEYLCFDGEGAISSLNDDPLKLADKFTYLSSIVSSTESVVSIRLAKALTAIYRLLILLTSDLSDKIKRAFFKVVVVPILLYGCTTWTLTTHREKRVDENCTRMLWVILEKSWKQHPTNPKLYGYLPPITKTIQVRRTKYAGHCWRSMEGPVLVDQPGAYLRQLCGDTRYSLEDLPGAKDNRERERESQGNPR